MTPDRKPEPLPPAELDEMGFDLVSRDLPQWDVAGVTLDVDEPTEDTAPYVPLAR